jgi:hypothetical protein
MGHVSENKEMWDINLIPGATVNTNAAGYKMLTVMAEANGQGIPLGFFMHVSTNSTAASGAKGWVLNDFLARLVSQLSISY